MNLLCNIDQSYIFDKYMVVYDALRPNPHDVVSFIINISFPCTFYKVYKIRYPKLTLSKQERRVKDQQIKTLQFHLLRETPMEEENEGGHDEKRCWNIYVHTNKIQRKAPQHKRQRQRQRSYQT